MIIAGRADLALKEREREERVRRLKEMQEDDRRRKLEELKQHVRVTLYQSYTPYYNVNIAGSECTEVPRAARF